MCSVKSFESEGLFYEELIIYISLIFIFKKLRFSHNRFVEGKTPLLCRLGHSKRQSQIKAGSLDSVSHSHINWELFHLMYKVVMRVNYSNTC